MVPQLDRPHSSGVFDPLTCPHSVSIADASPRVKLMPDTLYKLLDSTTADTNASHSCGWPSPSLQVAATKLTCAVSAPHNIPMPAPTPPGPNVSPVHTVYPLLMPVRASC